MTSVTNAFARTMAKAAGMTLTDDGALISDGAVLHRIRPLENGRFQDTDYFNLTEWIRTNHPDEIALIRAYAELIQTDDLGVLGLAIKTAPTLRASLQRVERYYRLVTDTAVFHLDETGDPAFFAIVGQTADHPVLAFRNETALAGFSVNMRRIVGNELPFEFVSFRHACRSDADRYAEHFGCPVRFDANRDAIAFDPATLSLPNRLGDPAVSDFLTAHLETEISSIADTPSLANTLVRRLTPALSNGLPQTAQIAREIGLSERTLYRRLADEGLTFRDVLGQAQSALAQELLRDGDASIAEIAFLTGFSEQSTFSRAFKRWVGQAPAQFRQNSSNT
tara:strand:- start:17624 stop:18634 length:1011 start_codon:yes stop_codon:yes gene_type:complete